MESELKVQLEQKTPQAAEMLKKLADDIAQGYEYGFDQLMKISFVKKGVDEIHQQFEKAGKIPAVANTINEADKLTSQIHNTFFKGVRDLFGLK